METITAVSEQEIQETSKCNSNVTNEQVKEISNEAMKILTKTQIRKEKRKIRKQNRKSYNKTSTEKNRQYDVHHIVPRGIGGSNHPDNKLNIKRTRHEGLNAYIGNKTVDKIVEQILDEHITTLHKDYRDRIKEEIMWVLKYYSDDNKLFNENCFRDKNRIPKVNF